MHLSFRAILYSIRNHKKEILFYESSPLIHLKVGQTKIIQVKTFEKLGWSEAAFFLQTLGKLIEPGT